MSFRFLSAGEKKKIMAKLHERFGISEVDGLLVESGKQKIRLFTGSLSREELNVLGELVRVELVGMYFAREDLALRLSFDGSQLVGKEISENVIELSDDEAYNWIRGAALPCNKESGLYAVKWGDDFMGCGYVGKGVLQNYVPRERQIKVKQNR